LSSAGVSAADAHCWGRQTADPPSNAGPVGVGQAQPPLIHEWKYDFQAKVIKGEVYNYPGHEDAAPISTSEVASAEGSIFSTHTGSRYELGNVDHEFRDQLDERDLWDPDDPLQVFPANQVVAACVLT
jgi:hypothetical protein